MRGSSGKWSRVFCFSVWECKCCWGEEGSDPPHIEGWLDYSVWFLSFFLFIFWSSSFLVCFSFVLFFCLFVVGSDPTHIGWWLDYAIVEFDFHKIASRDPGCWRVGNWQILPDGSFCRCRNLILSIPTRISPHRPEDMEIHNSGLKLHGFGVLMQYLSLATRW